MFVFKLQSVLDVRQALEEKLLLSFSDEKRRLEREQEALAGLEWEISILMNQLKSTGTNPQKASDISLLASYIDFLKKRAREQEDIVISVSLQVEKKREQLVEAMKERKTIERLKEKHFMKFRKDMEHKEWKNTDELTVIRFSGGVK